MRYIDTELQNFYTQLIFFSDIMAPNFCSDCGNILSLSVESEILCRCCGARNSNTNCFATTLTTTQNFPSRLREILTSQTQELTAKDFESTRIIERECPECQAKVMTWSEAQLRSADEGSTIFYRCVCGYRSKEDN
ncbi:unnamed protein product [Blumeria hordei]|uniref:DNA-directed RNA polymerase subunit n=1 Tax=Blumeria hordei TaxID=2867405 RepID=A0A383UL05_BLUHO|nr:unnamed protein product [Blumeria hordei]